MPARLLIAWKLRHLLFEQFYENIWAFFLLSDICLFDGNFGENLVLKYWNINKHRPICFLEIQLKRATDKFVHVICAKFSHNIEVVILQ